MDVRKMVNDNRVKHVCGVLECKKEFVTLEKVKPRKNSVSAHALLYVHVRKTHSGNGGKVSFACHPKCEYKVG